MNSLRQILPITLLLFSAIAPGGLAQGSAFTYQGRLSAVGSPANGQYEMAFTLYDAATNGSIVGTGQTVSPVAVTNGLFTITLNFGSNAFNGNGRWLEITLNLFGSDMIPTTLAPRQPIMPAPYAIHAANAAGLMTFNNAPLDIKVNGERALRLEPTSFFDSQITGAPNVIGGSRANVVTYDVTGATIAGGGAAGFHGSDHRNSIASSFATISGGRSNSVDTQAAGATIAGGSENTILSEGTHATIGGGFQNSVAEDAGASTIAGGWLNHIRGDGGTIGGGYGNTAAGYATVAGGQNNLSSGSFSTISGGIGNTNNREYATIGGGELNRCGGFYATVGGGRLNTSSGGFATVAGGYGNTASEETATVGGGFANTAGHESSTIAGGSDNSTSGDYATIGGGSGNSSSGDAATVGGGLGNISSGQVATIAGGDHNSANGWWATISGGESNRANGLQGSIGGGSLNRSAGNYSTVPGGLGNAADGAYSFAAGRRAQAKHAGAFVWGDSSDAEIASSTNDQFIARASGCVRFLSHTNGTAGIELAPGSGTWSSLSDRNAKENFTATNGREILEKVAALPLATWNYKSQDKSIRHIGPTAQEFRAAFGLGENDRTITTVDADGISLAAIQGLNQKVEEENRELRAALKIKATEIEDLRKDLDELRKLIGTR